jgi:hypothetical protein
LVSHLSRLLRRASLTAGGLAYTTENPSP